MNLEERYNSAAATSYVGRVRDNQAADVGGNKPGVDFMDGDGRGQWSSTGTPAPDQYQTEFKRNAEGDFRYDGGGKAPALTNNGSYPLSRWLPIAVNKVDFDFTNVRLTTIGNVRNAPGTLVHKYSTLSGKKFEEAAILSELAKGKLSGAASGPSPAGLRG